VLAGILGHSSVTLENLPEALRAYEHVRLPFVNDIIDKSRTAGALYELRSAHGDNYAALAPAIQNQWSWVESEDPTAQLERAVLWMTDQRGEPVRTSL
jgi:salicylate hydroxylase